MDVSRKKSDRLVPMAGSTSLGAVFAAGLLLCVVGAFHILLSLIGINGDDEAFATAHYSYDMSVTTWGWIHLVIGILAVVCGVGVLIGRTWAYLAALVVAFLSAVGQFAFLPHAPLWSLAVIAFDVLVIWALVVELNEPS